MLETSVSLLESLGGVPVVVLEGDELSGCSLGVGVEERVGLIVVELSEGCVL